MRHTDASSWYQTLPGPKLDIAPVSERLPRRPSEEAPGQNARGEGVQVDDLRKEMIRQRQERLDAFVADKMKWLERRAADSRERSKKNIEFAADVRKRFMESVRTTAG